MNKRIRYRGKQNTTCHQCAGPITYASPTSYTRRRCHECTTIRNRAANRTDKQNSRIRIIISEHQEAKGKTA